MSASAQTAATVAIAVDAKQGQHPISPLIYGVNFGTSATLKDLGASINRSGGNSASTYNWRLNARNAGKDWYYESLLCNDAEIKDQFGANFITQTIHANATPMISLSMLGWQANLAPENKPLASFSIVKYGPQQDNDDTGFYAAGNGISADGVPITNNDPLDAQMPNTVENEKARVQALTGLFGAGAHYYILDNEPSIWHLVHRDVHPVGAHADEIYTKTMRYANAVKTLDPKALVVAPEEWGWLGYHYSGFDQQYAEKHGLEHTPDREKIMQGMDYLPWLLSQWKAAGHPIDVFSLHFYPQNGEYSESDTPDIELLRNRSTRALWDPDYKDPSWINSTIALIPLMRHWVDQYYVPGTPIAITEYNWGGDKVMNGATTQADILGIFGREKLDIATRWGDLDPQTPVYKSIQLYRNYDGQGSGFGNTSIQAIAPNVDQVSAFAALRTKDNAVTIMVINKQHDQIANAAISLANIPDHGKVETWQLANNAMTQLPTGTYANGLLRATLPPQSITLFVLCCSATNG